MAIPGKPGIFACTCRNWRRRFAALSLIVVLVVATAPAQPTQAQLVTSPVPALTVDGNGEATVPADMATVQILIGLGDRQFGFSQDGSGHSSRESASASVSSDDEDSGGRRGERRSEPESITSEQVDAIVASIAEAAAAEPDAVETHLSPLAAVKTVPGISVWSSAWINRHLKA